MQKLFYFCGRGRRQAYRFKIGKMPEIENTITPKGFIITIVSVMIGCAMANVIAGNPKINFTITTTGLLGFRLALVVFFGFALIRGFRNARLPIATLLIAGAVAQLYIGYAGYEEKYSSNLVLTLTGFLNLGCGVALLAPFAGRHFEKKEIR